MELAIIPECYIDTCLIETLVPPKNGYNHQKGCGTVAKVMKERFTNDFALGIVDKDRKELDYLKEFTIVAAKGNLELLKHTSKNHFIIRIIPAMEKFLLTNSKQAGISLEDFDLPSDFEQFKKETKTVNSKKDARFKKLFKAMRGYSLEDFELLTGWVSYFVSHPFEVDVHELKAI